MLGLMLSAEPLRMPTGFLGAEMSDWALGFFLTLARKPACPGFAAYSVFHRQIQARLTLPCQEIFLGLQNSVGSKSFALIQNILSAHF